jgi:hypothetical protein
MRFFMSVSHATYQIKRYFHIHKTTFACRIFPFDLLTKLYAVRIVYLILISLGSPPPKHKPTTVKLENEANRKASHKMRRGLGRVRTWTEVSISYEVWLLLLHSDACIILKQLKNTRELIYKKLLEVH